MGKLLDEGGLRLLTVCLEAFLEDEEGLDFLGAILTDLKLGQERKEIYNGLKT